MGSGTEIKEIGEELLKSKLWSSISNSTPVLVSWF